MKTDKDPIYLTLNEWVAKGYRILHCQSSFEKDENGIELFSDHQVTKEKILNESKVRSCDK